jgi:signal transduction histidine kinase
MDVVTIDLGDSSFSRYGDILFTLEKTVKNNPKLVKNMYEASKKGFEYAFANIDEMIDIIYNKYNTQNKTKKALMYEAEILSKMAGLGEDFGNIDQSKVESIAYIYSYSEQIPYNSDNLKNFIYKQKAIQKSLNFNQKELKYLKNKKTIKMCVDSNWMPFEGIDQNGKYTGIGADIIQIISKKIKKPIELYPTTSWSKTMESFKEKKCDILPIASKTTNRQKLMNFTNPYIKKPLVVVTKEDQFFIQDSSELINKKIGIVQGYALIELLKQKQPHIDIVSVKNTKDGLEKVQNGELFGFADALASIAYIIQKEGILDLKITGRLEFDVKLSIASQKSEPLLNSIMQKALNSIEQEQINSIIGKWISIKVEQSYDYRTLMYISIVFLVIIILILHRHITVSKINKKLKKVQKELSLLNQTLEERVKEEVNKNRKKEKMMLHQNRLAQMGEMISMIAHQWRQPLNNLSVLNQTILLKHKLSKLDDEIMEDFKHNSKKQIHQMTQTIDDFSDFFKPDKEKTNFFIDEALNDTIEILKPLFEKNKIDINLNIEDKYSLFSYKNEFGQALLNILNNAKDALIENEIENKKIDIHINKENQHILLNIKDNAGGISDEIIENIFDPYFSTKDEKNGTGLGLYMTKIIIEDHMGGRISVQSKNDNSTFSIRLNS